MGKAKFKDPAATISWPLLDEHGEQVGTHVTPAGAMFEFEWSPLLSRFAVDFDPGPELRAGFYSEQEFSDTFDVIEE